LWEIPFCNILSLVESRRQMSFFWCKDVCNFPRDCFKSQSLAGWFPPVCGAGYKPAIAEPKGYAKLWCFDMLKACPTRRSTLPHSGTLSTRPQDPNTTGTSTKQSSLQAWLSSGQELEPANTSRSDYEAIDLTKTRSSSYEDVDKTRPQQVDKHTY
jgi:hypothetical protein